MFCLGQEVCLIGHPEHVGIITTNPYDPDKDEVQRVSWPSGIEGYYHIKDLEIPCPF